MQSLPKCPSLWQLQHLLSLAAFLLLKFRPFDIIARSPVTLVVRLVMNFASAEARICCISSIVLSPRSSMVVVVVSKSSCKESSATTIAMLSQMSRFGVIAARSRFIKNRTSAKMVKPFSVSRCDPLEVLSLLSSAIVRV